MQRERERGTVKIAQEDPTALRTVCGTQEVLPNIKPEPLPLLSELLKKKKQTVIHSGCEKAIHFSLLLYSSSTFLFYSPKAKFRQMQIRKHHRLHCELETRK